MVCGVALLWMVCQTNFIKQSQGVFLSFSKGEKYLKEGINLFDMEERQRSAARAAAVAAAERTAALNSWIKSQQDTLDTMAENQRRHNERMEEEARRATEKIDREIDRLNNR